MPTFIDLSVSIKNNVHTDHPGGSPEVTYIDHSATASGLEHFFPGLKPEDLPDEEGWAVESVKLSTHNGTHMDAPWHFHSTTNYGRDKSPTIDETPLEYCFQPGVKLDFRHFEDGYLVTAEDIERELDRIDHKLKPLDIVFGEHKGWFYLRPTRICRRGLRDGERGNPLSHKPWGQGGWNRRLVLGSSI